jgi:hypothetical protein
LLCGTVWDIWFILTRAIAFAFVYGFWTYVSGKVCGIYAYMDRHAKVAVSVFCPDYTGSKKAMRKAP